MTYEDVQEQFEDIFAKRACPECHSLNPAFTFKVLWELDETAVNSAWDNYIEKLYNNADIAQHEYNYWGSPY